MTFRTQPMLRTLGITAAAAMLMGAAGFAWQWPIQLDAPDAGAYRLVIDEQVYARATDAQLADVQVLDAAGQAVPAMLFATDAPTAQAPQLQDVPWFALPSAQAVAGSDVRVISERSDDGRVLRVETHRDTSSASVQAWLADASALTQPLTAIHLQLPADAVLDVTWRIEGSDDLRQWRTLQASANTVQLQRDGQRLQQLRIPLDASANYLRLLPQSSTSSISLNGVKGETRSAAIEQQRHWQTFDASSSDGRQFVFHTPAAAPYDRVDIVLPGNVAATWRLESRSSNEATWRVHSRQWNVFQLTQAERSPAQVLAAPVRERQWRLSTDANIATAPQLKLGYLPDVLVFVAAGQAPYRLAVGSATQRRSDAPLDAMLAQLRQTRGSQWQPAQATLQGSGEAADARALEQPRDWKTFGLWAVLLLAALLVGFFAISLLRGQRQDTPPSA